MTVFAISQTLGIAAAAVGAFSAAVAFKDLRRDRVRLEQKKTLTVKIRVNGKVTDEVELQPDDTESVIHAVDAITAAADKSKRSRDSHLSSGQPTPTV